MSKKDCPDGDYTPQKKKVNMYAISNVKEPKAVAADLKKVVKVIGLKG